MTDDEHAIRDLVATWMQASQAGDLDTVLGLMEDGVIFMVPGVEPFGKEAFAAASQGMKDMRMEGTSIPSQIFGDWAYLRNCIAVTMTPPREARAARRLHPHGPAQTDGRSLAAQPDANLLSIVEPK